MNFSIIVLCCALSIVLAADLEGPKNATNDNVRIVGGIVAHSGQFPFVVGVHHTMAFLCGGALISVNWVVTSAECIYPYVTQIPLQLRVSLGGLRHSGIEPGRYEIPSNGAVLHPGFHSRKEDDTRDYFYYNNIALLRLQYPAAIGATISPIPLPMNGEIINAGTSVMFAGWGGSTDFGPSDVLQYVLDSKIMDLQQCMMSIGVQLDMTHACIVPNYQNAACKYDHGSPLFRFDPIYGFVLLGVVNYAPCSATFQPTIFSNVPAHRYWISTVTGF